MSSCWSRILVLFSPCRRAAPLHTTSQHAAHTSHTLRHHNTQVESAVVHATHVEKVKDNSKKHLCFLILNAIAERSALYNVKVSRPISKVMRPIWVTLRPILKVLRPVLVMLRPILGVVELCPMEK